MIEIESSNDICGFISVNECIKFSLHLFLFKRHVNIGDKANLNEWHGLLDDVLDLFEDCQFLFKRKITSIHIVEFPKFMRELHNSHKLLYESFADFVKNAFKERTVIK